MASSDFLLTVLGTRGSTVASGPAYTEFGGNTSCYLIQAGKNVIYLDAGSGLISSPETLCKTPVILLSHLHLDHLLGLGMSPLFAQRDTQLSLYVPFCGDKETARDLIARLYSPPFWPLCLDELGSHVRFCSLSDSFNIGEVRIETMQGSHPGGCIVYKLQYAGKAVIYATDYEHSKESDVRLISFADGADLMLYDAQYDSGEYEEKKGFGHSTAEKGIEIMECAHVKRLLLIHHGVTSTDFVLREREENLNSKRVSYAREGQTIIL